MSEFLYQIPSSLENAIPTFLSWHQDLSGPPTPFRPKQRKSKGCIEMASRGHGICFLPPWKAQPISIQLPEESATNLELKTEIIKTRCRGNPTPKPWSPLPISPHPRNKATRPYGLFAFLNLPNSEVSQPNVLWFYHIILYYITL